MENLSTSAIASGGPTLLGAILTFVICFVAMKLILKLVDRLLGKANKLDGTLKGFIRSAANILLWIILAVIVAGALGIPTSSMVALISIAGLALSLSVQNILANLFSGLTLLVTKPFKAGDYVEVAGKAGIVKTVGLFYTQMDTLDNVAISIPNSDITGSSVNNYSSEPLRRVDLTFNASYDCSTDEVKAAILDAISKGPGGLQMEAAPEATLAVYNNWYMDEEGHPYLFVDGAACYACFEKDKFQKTDKASHILGDKYLQKTHLIS